MKLLAVTAVIAVVLAGCAQSDNTAGAADTTIYSGGDILTMVGKEPAYTEALVVQGGKISFVGTKDEAMRRKTAATRVVDLQGHTLLPGFIDAHGHLALATHTLLDADLRGVKNIPELLERLRAHAAGVPEGQRIVGMGYRADQMEEKRHPTKEELDSVSAGRPIMISDGSGHHGVANSALLAELGLGPDTPDPEGGTYYRKPGSRELDGHLAEKALMSALATRAPLTPDQIRTGVTRAVAQWTANGQTTACEMGLGLSADDLDIAKTIIDDKLLPIDLVVFAKASVAPAALDLGYQVARTYDPNRTGEVNELLQARPDLDKRYINRVRLAGIKFWMDGSLDTALLSQPYTHNPPGIDEPLYTGTRVDSQDEVESLTKKYWKTDLELAAHVNGDEAAEQFLVALEKAAKEEGANSDARPIFQHALLLRPDQVDRIAKLGATTSFTAAGIYAMGDYLTELYGPQRAHWAGAAREVQDKGINWTSNHDMPAGLSPSLIYAMWNLVNRTTKSGAVIAPEERVSAYDALKSITANAAYQYKEESTKGTLEAGKLADLVVLDKNPVKVDPMSIRDITVVETIKEGNVVYGG